MWSEWVNEASHKGRPERRPPRASIFGIIFQIPNVLKPLNIELIPNISNNYAKGTTIEEKKNPFSFNRKNKNKGRIDKFSFKF